MKNQETEATSTGEAPLNVLVRCGGYSSEVPTEVGAWWMVSEESEYESDAVELRIENGFLVADHPDIGVYPVEILHDGLTNVGWKKA